MTSPSAKALADRNAMFVALEHVLRAQLDGHQRILTCIKRKREAIRQADIAEVDRICADENTILKRVSEFEKHRLELVGRSTLAISPRASVPLTISEISSAAPEPLRTTLAVLGAQLREALMDVKRESSIVRAAAEALSRHMSGIVQTVHSALSRAGVYGARGSMSLGVQLHSAVDLKS
jgi:hypothetical protein